MIDRDKRLEYLVIDKYCTFNYLLSYIDRGFRETEGKCFCPFHENTNTPSAKLYQDEHGECIYCFSEGKRYYPHHLLTKEIVPFTTNHVFSSIWNQLSLEEKAQFGVENISRYKVDLSFYYDRYKTGVLTLRDVVEALLTSG